MSTGQKQAIFAGIVTICAALIIVSSLTDHDSLAWWQAPVWAANAAIWTWVAILKEARIQQLTAERTYGDRP